ncbi:MAG: M28 family peptidase [Thermodesulfobacteriota bacterium]
MENHISWLDVEEKELEKKVLAEYSKDEIGKHLEYLAGLTRRAGTEDEQKAAKYIQSRLDEYGVESEIYEFDAYVSLPGEASLEVLSPVRKSLASLSGVFITPTPPEGLEAELVCLGERIEERSEEPDLSGKIVLIAAGREGRVEATRLARKKGAAGQIHITPGKTRAMIAIQPRDVWGSPTPETIDKNLSPPIISVCNEDGRYLLELVRKGPVIVRLKANAWSDYRKVRLPTGRIRGTEDPDKFVLVGGHYCSWFLGASDNAVANSVKLEMARIFSKYRKKLKRGIRFCWWIAHEQGTFGGSTWYVDHFWDDLRDHAVAYLAMDGLGRKGSSGFEARNSEEIRKFQEQIIKEVLGLRVKSKRVQKSGDQSFWGVGLPSLIGGTLFDTPESPGEDPVWYSHTAEDTLDKVDRDLIQIPFRVHAVSILRLCNNPILPMEFVGLAKEIKEGLKALQLKGESIFDLKPLIVEAGVLEKKAKALNQTIDKRLSAIGRKRKERSFGNDLEKINRCLMQLSRVLLPVFSTKAGKYGQDLWRTKIKPILPLQRLDELRSLRLESEEYKAFRTLLLRERNKVSDALHLANRLLEETIGG